MGYNEKLLQQIEEMGEKGLSVGEIAKKMNVKTKFEKRRLAQTIKNFLQTGKIVGKGKNKISRVSKKNLVKGVLQGHRRGFAFLIREDNEEDVFIPNRQLNGALHGDTVLVSCSEGRNGGREGVVMQILKRGIIKLVGTFVQSGKNGYVIPDNDNYFKDIFVPSDKVNGATPMSKVVVNINDDITEESPKGEIISVLGKRGERNAEVLSILRNYGFSEVFPEEVVEQAEKIEYKPENRKDLTKLLTITIDGDDAKDFDDAISIEKLEAGFRLYVHIADVSHYVRSGGIIDKEAFNRATSVYFPGNVFPMLPESISNGVCSLRPDEDKLAITVAMDTDNKGNVISSHFYESLIRSDYRMTYTNVTKILEGDKDLREKYHKIIEMIEDAKQLSDLIAKSRKEKGMINFGSRESKIDLDEKGDVIDIYPYPESISNQIIEQFMITANETVATYISKKNLPCVYRIHEKVSEEKLANFIRFIKGFGYDLDIRNGVHPKLFSDLLDTLKGQDAEQIISKIMLRSMQKAKYTTYNSGHFGLSLDSYCHFTSPIRRYPDLMVHRTLKAMINNRINEAFVARTKGLCEKAATQSTEREIAAASSERDIDDYYKALYMQKFVGKRYHGLISGVIATGIFVILENTVEGFVALDDLPFDRYDVDDKSYCIRGRRYTYTLSDKIEVEIKASYPDRRKIDMIAVEEDAVNHLNP